MQKFVDIDNGFIIDLLFAHIVIFSHFRNNLLAKK